MKTLSLEQLSLLKSPLPEEAVKQHPTKTYLSSIKAIYVTERMNDVFGVGQWHTKVRKEVDGGGGMIVVHVTFEVPEYGIYYECFGGNDNGGEANKNFDLGDAYKGATTDAITKIGSYLGIGIDVFKGKTTTYIHAKKENEPEKPWLNKGTPAHKRSIEVLKSKEKNLSDIKAVFKLSKEMEAELKAIADAQ
jgi:hypothetical protein